MIKFAPLIMSWDKPIEQEILEFVTSMANQMDNVATNGQREVREGAEHYKFAYTTVRNHILKEIEFRKSIKPTNLGDGEPTLKDSNKKGKE